MKREEDDMIPLVMEIYKVNQRRAIEYLGLMNEDQKKELRIGRGGSNIPK
jgi:DNA-binding protein Fis